MKLFYLGKELDSSAEQELKTDNEFGFVVTIKFNPDNRFHRDTETSIFRNATEVHSRYTEMTIRPGKRIAFESDIHQTGFWKDIEEIETVTIEYALEMYSSAYMAFEEFPE